MKAHCNRKNQKLPGQPESHYMRDLLARFGPIEKICAHRTELTGMEFNVFGCCERRRRDVDAAMSQLLLSGVGMCELNGISKQLHG